MSNSIKTDLTVLVAGATGNQGGAVARALLERGHKVRALTRNVDSTRSVALRSLGAEMVAGDMNNADSIRAALEGADSFYLMGSPFEEGVDAETEQGIMLADAAKNAGVKHLVYGSVANADLDTHIPHFDSKYKVEQHIKTLGIDYTISAPVYFMDNLIAPWATDALKAGKIIMAMPEDVMLQQVSVKNIGDFVASLISRCEPVFGQRYDFAGDELTGAAMSQAISSKLNSNVKYEALPLKVLRKQSDDMARMYEWFAETGYNVDIPALQTEFKDVPWQNYEKWLDTIDLHKL